MKLAIVLTQPFWYDGEAYTTRYPFALFMIGLAKHIDSLLFFVPLKVSNDEHGDYSVVLPDNVKIIPYPYCYSLREQYAQIHRILPEFIRVFLANTNSFDICCFTNTNIISFTGFLISIIKSKEVVLYLRNNLVKCYSVQIQSSFGRFVGYCLGLFEEILCRIMIRKSTTFVIGRELFKRYEGKSHSLYLFYENLISNDQIKYRKNMNDFIEKKVSLLSVGRLVPQKGLEYLINAVEELVNDKGYDVLCNFVGSGIEEDKLRDLIDCKGLTNSFKFCGNLPWDNALFRLYKESDIFVLSSLTEGFPKTLFEALAFGTAVVATNVGGVSGIIKNGHNGMLVEPRSSSDITAAIVEICFDERLLRNITNNGYSTAKEYTIERQHLKLISILKNRDLKATKISILGLLLSLLYRLVKN